MIDPTLLSLVTQGGFAALFVWLLMDSRKDAREREKRLMDELAKYAEALPRIVSALQQIESRLERIEERRQ